MTTVSATAAPAAEGGFLARHHFLLRRLHSLSGIVPIGLFVCFHLFTNMQMILGDFQHEVDWIHSQPAVLLLEIFGIWLPIAFHAGLGIVYTFTGKPNTGVYGYSDNWRYTFQRITGIIALIFIFYHVATLRWRWNLGDWSTPFFTYAVGANPDGQTVPFAMQATAIAVQHSIAVLLLYIVGVLAVTYHFANGVWTAAISWGLTLTQAAQRRFGYVCIVIFLGLIGCGAAALYSAWTYHVTEADWADYARTKVLYQQTGIAPEKGQAFPYMAEQVGPDQYEYKFMTPAKAH